MPLYPRFLLLAVFCLLGMGAQADANVAGPPLGDSPVRVEIGFLLSNINAIYEEDETFDFEGILSMHWKDSRLAFDPAATGYDELYYQGDFQFNEVFSGWWPQIILANEAGRFDREGVMLRITPDGSVYYTEEIDAIAKSYLELARYPFDRQQLVAIFEVLGMNSSQVSMQADATTSGIWMDEHHEVRVPQWRQPALSTSIVEYTPIYFDGSDVHLEAFRVQIDIERDYWYTLRLVALPVMIFVMMSWSVFWMERSSLGDRMDISFIGILTVVAYQIMSSESLPKISYITVLMSFMIISFLMMCASIVINLRVAALDNTSRQMQGDRVDKLCRVLFPATYVLLNLLVGSYVYIMG
ncbi:Proton-gated ion channel [Halioglobus japonicus]|nr:Proton-gated ion channel [Halioglobus japonicus]